MKKLVWILFTLILVGCFAQIDDTDSVVTYSKKIVVEATLSATEMWRIKKVDLPHSDISSGLLVSSDYVVIVSLDDSQQYILNTISAGSGEALWNVNVPSVDSMIMDGERIYVAVDWAIQAYEISTGNLVWHSEQLPQHTSYRFHPSVEEKVLVYSTEDYFSKREQVLRYYNVQDGTLETVRQEIPTDEWLVLRQPKIDFWAKKDGKVWAVSKPDSTILWEFYVDQQYNNTPLLTEAIIFLLDGPFPELNAVDVRSGALVWEYNEEIVSNIVTNQSVLYVLDINNTLIALDLHTGQEVGYIEFENSIKMTPETDPYWIAVTDDNLFVYFGDSEELIAFKFTVP